jgi:hypothetical protein
VDIYIGKELIQNTLIDLGGSIDVMKKEKWVNYTTPIVLQMARSPLSNKK